MRCGLHVPSGGFGERGATLSQPAHAQVAESHRRSLVLHRSTECDPAPAELTRALGRFRSEDLLAVDPSVGGPVKDDDAESIHRFSGEVRLWVLIEPIRNP